MPQLHLYLPADAAEQVRQKAKARGMSVSRYLAELVMRSTVEEWPAGYFDEVVGSWKGGALERPRQEREPLR